MGFLLMRKKINSIFIGGKNLGYGCLEHLITKKIKPRYIVANIDDIGKDNAFSKSLIKLAKKNKIKVVKIDKLYRKIINNKQKIDIIFCIGSTMILPKEILKIPILGTLNIHPSLLPNFRGRYSIPHAIFENKKYTGLTGHWISEKIDSGEILFTKKIIINDADTAETIYKKFTKYSLKEFKIFVAKILKNNKNLTKKVKIKQGSYRKKLLPNNGKIDWNWSGKKIFNFIRSMIHEPFPPPTMKIGKKTYYILSKKYINKKKLLKSPV